MTTAGWREPLPGPYVFTMVWHVTSGVVEEMSGTSATKSLGGGSSAVAASTHAACARFRGTDPLVTGLTRRTLADKLGHPDTSAGIPEARWMRAMTFERLVRDKTFASQTATTTVGALGLDRPTEVVVVDARVNTDRTAQLLADAHDRALADGAATLIHQLAIPFVGYEDTRATDVKPDFAVVAPKVDMSGSWLVMGDAKDYERHRSRVEDTRLLKGFLQVAVGAESAAAWTLLPDAMEVHEYGALAVPRNAFLQPEALVDDIGDHRYEVRMRIEERRREAERTTYDHSEPLSPFVAHLRATFDPSTCPSCALFVYCRQELRDSTEPSDLLIELGVPKDARPLVVGLVDGTGVLGAAPPSTIANVRATVEKAAQFTHQRRVDPIGQPGTLNVVIAKSDAASLGVHGLAIQRVSEGGPGEWQEFVYEEPQSPETRRAIMRTLGKELSAALKDRRRANPEGPEPIHLVVPDKMTADVLASIADNLAGLELSRLRWARDKELGRPQLTWNGDPATIPAKLSETDRTAVSFLLEEDRARAFTMRCPIVLAQPVLARHLVTGGPAINAFRLDYLAAWLQPGLIEHRALSDEVEALEHTPGARLTNQMSNDIHEALSGPKNRKGGRTGAGDPVKYDALVRAELRYKCAVLDATVTALAELPDSRLREVHRAIEGSAQAVWRRRLQLHASDLVRFGRTYRHWRNSQVPSIESDAKCRDQLLILANPQAANELATDAGNRHVAYATVVSAEPIVLDVKSRRIVDGSRIVLLHVNDEACVEDPDVDVTALAGSFRFSGLSIGPLDRQGIPDDADPNRLRWSSSNPPTIKQGDQLVIADFSWFSDAKKNVFLNVSRPTPDSVSAPKVDCAPDSYANDPGQHQYCCRPHEDAEADWSDKLAARRAAGELNPQTWPPVRDGDSFETPPAGAPVGDPFDAPPVSAPGDLTIDDLD